MAAITESEAQALIIDEVGDIDPATKQMPVWTPPATSPGICAKWMPTLWAQYAAYDSVSPRLREFAVKRKCILLVLAQLRDKAIDISQPGIGLQIKEHQRVDTLLAQLEACNAEITNIIKSSQGVGGVSAVLPTVYPVPAPPMYPEANDQVYSGSPYETTRQSPELTP